MKRCRPSFPAEGGIHEKKVTALLLVLLIIFAPAASFAQSQNIQIKVNGRPVETDVSPFIENNRTYVPVRFVTEALGGEVAFDTEMYDTPAILVYNDDDIWLTLFIGHRKALYGESVMANDVPPIIRNNRTMVPVRFIAAYLGCEIGWDQGTRTIYIDQVNNSQSFDKYSDEAASKKISDWLIKPNHKTSEYLRILE